MRSTTPHDMLALQNSANEQSFITELTVENAQGAFVELDKKQHMDLCAINPHNLLGHNVPSIRKAIGEHLYDCVVSNPWQPRTFSALTQRLENLAGTEFTLNSITSHVNQAFENALKTCHLYWCAHREPHRNEILCFSGSAFGSTLSAVNINRSAFELRHFSGISPKCTHIPLPYTWLNDPSASTKETIALERLRKHLKDHHENILSFLFEPIFSTARGMYYTRPSFQKAVANMMHEYNIPVVADERFVAPYKLGSPLGYEQATCTPDVIILGATLTNGLFPLGCTLIKNSIQNAITRYTETPFYTDDREPFIHPVVAATVNATLDCITSRKFISQLEHISKAQKAFATKLLHSNAAKNVRICGSLLAFDLNCDSKQHSEQLNNRFLTLCKEQGVLLRSYGGSIALTPPITHSLDLNIAYNTITECLQTFPVNCLSED